jgi:hypothetical protein
MAIKISLRIDVALKFFLLGRGFKKRFICTLALVYLVVKKGTGLKVSMVKSIVN